MGFDELIAALGSLVGVDVRLQVGTHDHEQVALEATGTLRVEAIRSAWAVFCLDGPPVRMHLRRSEFGEATGALDGSGPVRFVTSGVEFHVTPTAAR